MKAIGLLLMFVASFSSFASDLDLRSTAGAAASTYMNRTYSLPLFETELACKEAQKRSGWFNCYQTISLYETGKAMVMLTDIMNPATYTLVNENLTVTLIGSGDAPPKMTFRLTRNKRNLIDEHLQVWEWRE